VQVQLFLLEEKHRHREQQGCIWGNIPGSGIVIIQSPLQWPILRVKACLIHNLCLLISGWWVCAYVGSSRNTGSLLPGEIMLPQLLFFQWANEGNYLTELEMG
jgi:hypothetical protein